MLSTLDVVLLVFLAWQAWRGFRLGLINSLIKLVGWGLALWLGSALARQVAPTLSGWVADPAGQRLLAFVLVAGLVLLMLVGVGLLLRRVVQAMALGPAERVLGGLFGLAKGGVVVLLLVAMLERWVSDSGLWQRSQVIAVLSPWAPSVLGTSRQVVGQAWQQWREPVGQAGR